MSIKITFIILVLLVAAWIFRYDITPVQPVKIASDATGVAYVLDRWTGHIYIMAGRDRLATDQ